ncbi:MAG: DUF4347 domain-containing protein [Leptolyngbya sp. SIO3F4]|nr:DUF4347 domain-containing protein [Leptolyngbya sp. SIO3F4]
MSTQNPANQGPIKASSIAFVDSNIAHTDDLLKAIQTDQIVLLNDRTNGIEQITQTLADYSNLESVHIFSHGSIDTTWKVRTFTRG